MNRRTVVLSTAICIGVFTTSAEAYRPFDSTDAAVAREGRCEIELGPVGYIFQPDGDLLVAPAVIFNFALSGRWEAVLEGKNMLALGDAARHTLSLRDNAA